MYLVSKKRLIKLLANELRFKTLKFETYDKEWYYLALNTAIDKYYQRYNAHKDYNFDDIAKQELQKYHFIIKE